MTQHRSIAKEQTLEHNTAQPSFTSTPEQKTTAEKLIEELTKEEIWNKPIVTEVEPLKVFYNAETYHKDYYKKHPKEPYCQAVIAPKIAKLQAHFIDKIKVPL